MYFLYFIDLSHYFVHENIKIQLNTKKMNSLQNILSVKFFINY